MTTAAQTEVLYSDLHKWHVLYNGTLVLRGQATREIAEDAARDIAANGGSLPRKSRRTGKLDLRTGKQDAQA